MIYNVYLSWCRFLFPFQLLQSYAVSALSLLLWERYVPSVLTKKKVEPKQKSQASLQRLLGYMKPYQGRFTAVLLFVVASSLGNKLQPCVSCCCVLLSYKLWHRKWKTRQNVAAVAFGFSYCPCAGAVVRWCISTGNSLRFHKLFVSVLMLHFLFL